MAFRIETMLSPFVDCVIVLFAFLFPHSGQDGTVQSYSSCTGQVMPCTCDSFAQVESPCRNKFPQSCNLSFAEKNGKHIRKRKMHNDLIGSSGFGFANG